ncbi:MAG: EAL domain-containing protein [Betaproteobacteria bacterium]|nr:EAL domain-containing protein [Betaproteobacteria bacterium]
MTDRAPSPKTAETEPLLRLLADNIPILIAYYRVEGLICEFANAAYARAYSKDGASIIGKDLRSIIGDEAMVITKAWVDQVAERGETARYERALVYPNGTTGYIEVTLVPHFDPGEVKPHGAFVLVNDITRYRAAEIAIRESEERLKKFFDATTEGLVFIEDGIIIDCNSAVARMVRLSERELIGRRNIEFIAPESIELVAANIKSGFDRPYEAVLLRADGSRFTAELNGKDVETDGKTIRMTAVRDISERKQAEARIQFLAHHDTLTHLPNRALIMDRLQVVLSSARRQSQMVAVLFIDLDNFKTINDSLGHFAGDELLKRVASRLKDCLRESDLVGRLGGDEFLVVVTGMHQETDAVPIAEKIEEVITEPFSFEEQVLSVSGSIGIAVFPKDGHTPETLVRNADAAMYLAKDQGRSNYQFFLPSLNKAAFETLAMESGIRKAIKQVEFLLHYQPQVSLQSGQVESVEALIRWQHPELGLLGPGQFISVAEHRGLIVPIGRWVINEAIRQARVWHDAGIKNRIAINLSAVQFKQQSLVDDIAARLREHGVTGECIEIELTESLFMEDVNSVSKTLGRLKDLGVSLAVDDFGTGYSSLSYLKRYPIDKIKIDRSFIRDVPADPDDVAIALAIIRLAHSLELNVVAEGVENATQLEFLRTHKCNGIQGYLVSHPLPPDEMPAWMRQPAEARAWLK